MLVKFGEHHSESPQNSPHLLGYLKLSVGELGAQIPEEELCLCLGFDDCQSTFPIFLTPNQTSKVTPLTVSHWANDKPLYTLVFHL